MICKIRGLEERRGYLAGVKKLRGESAYTKLCVDFIDEFRKMRRAK